MTIKLAFFFLIVKTPEDANLWKQTILISFSVAHLAPECLNPAQVASFSTVYCGPLVHLSTA